jgi:uncharacterized protein with PIN domain
MLGSLSKALRALGYDTRYADAGLSDDEVLEIAKRSRRILLTRDFALVARARKAGLDYVLVQEAPADEQLLLVLANLGLNPDPTHFLTRCTVCNGRLDPLDPKDVPADVPEGVRARHDTFQQCQGCRRVYWAGTHVVEMESRLRRVLEALNPAFAIQEQKDEKGAAHGGDPDGH